MRHCLHRELNREPEPLEAVDGLRPWTEELVKWLRSSTSWQGSGSHNNQYNRSIILTYGWVIHQFIRLLIQTPGKPMLMLSGKWPANVPGVEVVPVWSSLNVVQGNAHYLLLSFFCSRYFLVWIRDNVMDEFTDYRTLGNVSHFCTSTTLLLWLSVTLEFHWESVFRII